MKQKNKNLMLDSMYKKGFGLIPKFIMHDLDLSLVSKAIYAYFCALAGNDGKTFPFRETIIKDLNISKNTYYVHYNVLLEAGYIEVTRPFDMKAANIYTIVDNPKKLIEFNKSETGCAKNDGVKSKGYGMIPKLVMLDDRLTVKAKGLYAYLCSYCGNKRYSFPLKTDILYHLGISEPTYYKSLNELKECGYLLTEQRKCKGKFSVNDYYLSESISEINKVEKINTDEEINITSKIEIAYEIDISGEINIDEKIKKIEEIEVEKIKSPYQRNWDNKIWDNKNRDTRNCDTYLVTDLTSNNLTSNNQSIEKNLIDGLIYKINEDNKNHSLMKAVVEEIKNVQEKTKIPVNAEKGLKWICSCLENQGGEDVLFLEINNFVDNFQYSKIGKDINNPVAYFKVSVWNWFGQKTFVKQILNVNTADASYNIHELEELINNSPVYCV